MKRISTLLLLLITFTAFSQEQFFVGKDADLLIGKTVVLKEGLKFYSGFFKNQELDKILFKKGYGNDPEKLKGLNFTVTGSMKNPSKYKDEMVLVLQNKETGTVYYSYMTNYADLFLLDVVGGYTPPAGFLCTRLVPKKDKFSSRVTTSTPTTFEYSIIKIEENGEVILYLQLQSYGTTLNIEKTGVKILFSDGSIMNKADAKIKYTNASGTNGWTYSCFLRLTKEDVEVLTSKTITDYTLYIYDRRISADNAFGVREYLKCLSK